MNKDTMVKAVKQISIFLLLLVCVLFFLLKGKDISEIIATAAAAQLPFLAAGIIMAELFHVSEGLNIRFLLRAMGYPVTVIQGMKYAYIGFFFSSITPSSTGGQPMQLYAMKKDRIELSHGSLALLMELTSFQFITFLFEIIAVLMIPVLPVKLSGIMKVLAGLGFAFNLIFIVFLLIVILSKNMGRKLIGFLKKVIVKLPVIKADRKKEWSQKLDEGLEEFHQCAMMMKGNKKTIIKIMSVSVVQVVGWFSIPYMVYLSLGGESTSFLTFFLLQTILFMSSSLLPLPGAVGISELVFLQLFSFAYTKSSATAAMLLSRGIGFYFLLLFSVLMLLLLYFFSKKKKM